jgi:hypothetical protein
MPAYSLCYETHLFDCKWEYPIRQGEKYALLIGKNTCSLVRWLGSEVIVATAFLETHVTHYRLRPFQQNSYRREVTVTGQKQLPKPEVRWSVTVTLDTDFLAMA